ncbi:hypothetical protein DICA4_E28942 [Diutina catenulata]
MMQPSFIPKLVQTEVSVKLNDGREFRWLAPGPESLESKLAAFSLSPSNTTPAATPPPLPKAPTVGNLSCLVQDELLQIPSKFNSRTMIRWYTSLQPLADLADSQGRPEEFTGPLEKELTSRKRYKANISSDQSASEYVKAHIDHHSELLYQCYLETLQGLPRSNAKWRHKGRLKKYVSTSGQLAGDIRFMNQTHVLELTSFSYKLASYMPEDFQSAVPKELNIEEPLRTFQQYISDILEACISYCA